MLFCALLSKVVDKNLTLGNPFSVFYEHGDAVSYFSFAFLWKHTLGVAYPCTCITSVFVVKDSHINLT